MALSISASNACSLTDAKSGEGYCTSLLTISQDLSGTLADFERHLTPSVSLCHVLQLHPGWQWLHYDLTPRITMQWHLWLPCLDTTLFSYVARVGDHYFIVGNFKLHAMIDGIQSDELKSLHSIIIFQNTQATRREHLKYHINFHPQVCWLIFLFRHLRDVKTPICSSLNVVLVTIFISGRQNSI